MSTLRTEVLSTEEAHRMIFGLIGEVGALKRGVKWMAGKVPVDSPVT